MYLGHHIAEVTSLSPKATEKDVYDFFSHGGEIEHVEIIRLSEYASIAYVTFKDAYALETAILLSGSTILDQCVCVSRMEAQIDEDDPWSGSSSTHYTHTNEFISTPGEAHYTHTNELISTPGEALSMAQQVVETMIVKGHVLSKDALAKAKAFDESYQVSSTTAAKVAELSKRVGLTNKIQSGIETVKSVDEKYRVSEFTTTAASYTGKTAVAAANAVVNSIYFSKGALWVADVLSRAARVAADLGNNGINRETPLQMDQIRGK